MKLIIAGGRDQTLTELNINQLNEIEGVCEVVSGGAKGIDQGAEAWAKSKGIPIKQMKPEWSKFGRAAGPMRNRDMAGYADSLAVFDGGKGTQSMVNEARKASLIIFDFRTTKS